MAHGRTNLQFTVIRWDVEAAWFELLRAERVEQAFRPAVKLLKNPGFSR